VVVSSDTLEHVPPEEREGFISELVRVSKDCVVLAAPFADANVSAAEQILYDFIKNRLDYAHEFLLEHREHGLPRLERVEGFLKAKGWHFCVIPNGYLYSWLLMMLTSFYVQSLPDFKPLAARINAFYNATFYESDNVSPSYRKAIVISKRGRDLTAISRRYGEGQSDPARTALKLGLTQLFLSTLQLEQQKELHVLVQHNLNLERTIQARDEQIIDLRQHAHNLENLVKEKEWQLERVTKDRDEQVRSLRQHARNLEGIIKSRDEHIANLEQELSSYKQTIFYKIYARMKRLKEG